MGSRLRILLLLGLTSLPAAVETAVLSSLRLRPSLGLSILVTAPTPYGSLHDMLWTLVYHDSWPGFVLEIAAAIVFRGLLGAAAVALAWPADVPRPPLGRLVARNLAFAAVCAAIISPAAAMAMAASAIALSWFVFGELVPLLLFAPVLQRGGICPGWWRGLPSARLVVAALANFIILTATGTLIWHTPGPWAVLTAAAGGALNGTLWWYLVRTAVLAPVRLPRLPTVPIVAGVLVAGLILVAGGAGFGGSGSSNGQSVPPPTAQAALGNVHRQVLFLAGYDSAYNGQPIHSHDIAVYSYRGLDPAGNPLPYQPSTTHQPLDTSASLLAKQVDRLHQHTGHPIALVGVSEGALITRKYLEGWHHPNVDTAAVLSPVVRPGQVYYPPPHATHGWGLAGGWELRGVLSLVGLHHSTPLSADQPFVRSVLADAPLLRNRTLCPVPGVRMMAFLPSADAATIPPGNHRGVPAADLPTFHGGMLGFPAVQQQLAAFLNGANPGRTQRPDYSLVQIAASVWEAPPSRYPSTPPGTPTPTNPTPPSTATRAPTPANGPASPSNGWRG